MVALSAAEWEIVARIEREHDARFGLVGPFYCGLCAGYLGWIVADRVGLIRCPHCSHDELIGTLRSGVGWCERCGCDDLHAVPGWPCQARPGVSE